MKRHSKGDSLTRIALKITSSLDVREVLASITQGLVDELDAAFARIWLLGPGDLCAECYKADSCANRERCLHLEASAGIYTRIDGEYRRKQESDHSKQVLPVKISTSAFHIQKQHPLIFNFLILSLFGFLHVVREVV